MQRHTTSHLDNKDERSFSGDQVVGRKKPAYHQEQCSDIFVEVVLMFHLIHMIFLRI